jgi:regulator of nucleoside diphosphate kinase
MTTRGIYVTQFDLQRLRNLVRSTALSAGRFANIPEDLLTALEQSTPVRASDIPPDVVTMNSTVRLRDLESGEESIATIVFPHHVGEEEDRVSILSPLGSALFGFRQGDRITVSFPDAPRRLLIVEVLYQPEASGKTSMDFSS